MIYVIGEMNSDGTMTEIVKVGFVGGGERLKQRASPLQVGIPRRLVLIGKGSGERVQEKTLHRLFESDRVRRPLLTEWLRLDPGSAFAAWVDSVRCEQPTSSAHAVPIPVLSRVTCSVCSSEKHAKARCPSRPWKREADRVRRLERSGPAAVRPLPVGRWTWRGV